MNRQNGSPKRKFEELSFSEGTHVMSQCKSGLADVRFACDVTFACDVMFACDIILSALVVCFAVGIFGRDVHAFPAWARPSARIKAPMVGRFWAVHSQATSSPHSSRWELRTRVTPVVDRGELEGFSPALGTHRSKVGSTVLMVFVEFVGRPNLWLPCQ